MLTGDEQSNYETFRECLSDVLIRKLAVKPAKPQKRRAAKGRKNAIKPVEVPVEAQDEQNDNDAEELGEFIDYLASEIFPSLPSDLRTLSYTAIQNDASLRSKYTDPLPSPTIDSISSTLPPSAVDSLQTYASTDILTPLLTAYISAATAPPPIWTTTRASSCELCDRDWIPLTYHHLIPRGVHDKVRKRGWHEEWRLNSVAWLCRACHSFVHGVAGNEELAREWYTVELLRSREDVQRWAKWVGRVRWKSR